MAKRIDTPWLGVGRGATSDWLTQRWVQATGRREKIRCCPWLAGPVGATSGIGVAFFDTLALREGWRVLPPDPDAGLMASFDALGGPGFSPASVHPRVREFYEHTARFQLDLWSEWHGLFRPFGSLVAALFSRRLQQLNIPLRPLEAAGGLTSRVVQLARAGETEPRMTGWVRENPRSHTAVYIGAYSVVAIPGHDTPCVKVAFPLPNGNATVLMRASSDGDALVLESSGRHFGDPGFYFVARASETDCWVRFLRSFRETIRVYVDAADALRTDHTFSLWGQKALRLHYRIRRPTASR